MAYCRAGVRLKFESITQTNSLLVHRAHGRGKVSAALHRNWKRQPGQNSRGRYWRPDFDLLAFCARLDGASFGHLFIIEAYCLQLKMDEKSQNMEIMVGSCVELRQPATIQPPQYRDASLVGFGANVCFLHVGPEVRLVSNFIVHNNVKSVLQRSQHE